MNRIIYEAKSPKKTMLLLVFIVSSIYTLQGKAQVLLLFEGYEGRAVHDVRPILRIYEKEFESKEEAVESHKKVMGMNGIDTALTSVDWEMDTPIFSHMPFFENKKKVIVTYVTSNDEGGYLSVFMECKNVKFELFESDGYMLEYDPVVARNSNE
ncbi:MAG: hypothetical protein ACKO4Y_05975 [Flavobacteriales bacterium]